MEKSVEKYLAKLTPASPEVLAEMEAVARQDGFPIVGPLVGRLLCQLAMVSKARLVLEMGSGFGYSAFWFSLAIKGRGHITMTDSDRKNKTKAFNYFKRAGLQSRFDFLVGDALKIVRRLDGPFDIIFNDIDKQDYPQTIDLAAARLRKGGLFITDNLLWSGKVLGKKHDQATAGIVEFTDRLYKDSRFLTTVMPIRDGVSIALRV